jgi:hypothetical protein
LLLFLSLYKMNPFCVSSHFLNVEVSLNLPIFIQRFYVSLVFVSVHNYANGSLFQFSLWGNYSKCFISLSP